MYILLLLSTTVILREIACTGDALVRWEISSRSSQCEFQLPSEKVHPLNTVTSFSRPSRFNTPLKNFESCIQHVTVLILVRAKAAYISVHDTEEEGPAAGRMVSEGKRCTPSTCWYRQPVSLETSH